MAEQSTDVKTALEAERKDLLHRIDELTYGGEIDLDYDDNFADSGQVAAEQGEYKVLAESLQEQLRDVEAALAKFADGSYGKCATCGGPIGEARLEAMPATQYCIDHA